MTYLTINTTMIITNANNIIPANTPPNKDPESTSGFRWAESEPVAKRKH